jgi:hypothetical protein
MRQLFALIDIQQNGRISKPELFILFKKVWESPSSNPLQSAQYGQGYYQPNPYQAPQGPYSYGQTGQYNQQYGGQQGYQNNGNQPYGQPYGTGPYGQNPYGQNNWGGK